MVWKDQKETVPDKGQCNDEANSRTSNLANQGRPLDQQSDGSCSFLWFLKGGEAMVSDRNAVEKIRKQGKRK
jgi:hypothetical protein